jgi:hypothetical protein
VREPSIPWKGKESGEEVKDGRCSSHLFPLVAARVPAWGDEEEGQGERKVKTDHLDISRDNLSWCTTDRESSLSEDKK